MKFKELLKNITGTWDGGRLGRLQIREKNFKPLIEETLYKKKFQRYHAEQIPQNLKKNRKVLNRRKTAELIAYDNGQVLYELYDYNKSKKPRFTVFDVNEIVFDYHFADDVHEHYDGNSFLEEDAVKVLTAYGTKCIFDNIDDAVRKKNLLLFDPEKTDSKNKTSDVIEAMLDKKMLRENIESLRQAQQEAIKMHYFQEMTQQAIADKLGIKRESVKSRLKNAEINLKKMYHLL